MIETKLPPLPEPVATVKRTMSALTYKHKTSIGLSIGENALVTVAQAQDYATDAIEADRKRRGEPIGYIMPTALKQLKAGGNAIVGGVSQGYDVPLYTAPQPAETGREVEK